MKIEKLRKVVERACSDLADRIEPMKAAAQNQRPSIQTTERLVARVSHLADEGRKPSKVEQERILGTNDLVDLNFFDRGQRAARTVCRVILCDDTGRQIGVASGFMVSPRLMLTNHHVFPDRESANNCLAEFDYALDINGIERKGPTFLVRPQDFYESSETLDFALVAIEARPRSGTSRLSDFGYLRLNPTLGKINTGEFVSIIQHPSGLPKQVSLRENKLISIEPNFLVYASDTAQGSSGSPLFNDSWQVVGLHSAGVPRTDAQGNWLTRTGQVAGPGADDSDIDWIGNRGARVSRIIDELKKLAADDFLSELLDIANSEGGPAPVKPGPVETKSDDRSRASEPRPGLVSDMGDVPDVRVVSHKGGTVVELPFGFAARIERPGSPRTQPVTTDAMASTDAVSLLGAAEVYKEAVIDTRYSNRKGYKADFLSVDVPLPTVTRTSVVAKMKNGEFVIPYQNFSIVMHRERRLALFTAANIDGSKEAKEPDPRFDYSRGGLGGFEENDREMWTAETRIDASEQLPDRFYEKDRQAFDKGHIVRREDVAWGDTYAQVRRANGDSYHVTNCSPQVLAYNRSNKKGIWGLLENNVLKQAKKERLTVFAGPIFEDSDKVFTGQEADGSELKIQIPKRYWKLVVAEGDAGLESFAFVLEQDLRKVVWEFSVDAKWREFMVPIAQLQDDIGLIRFPKVVRDADQFGQPGANELLRLAAREPAGG